MENENNNGRPKLDGYLTPSGRVSLSLDSFEHLLACLTNQRFVGEHPPCGDALAAGPEAVAAAQAEAQAAVDDFCRQCGALERSRSDRGLAGPLRFWLARERMDGAAFSLAEAAQGLNVSVTDAERLTLELVRAGELAEVLVRGEPAQTAGRVFVPFTAYRVHGEPASSWRQEPDGSVRVAFSGPNAEQEMNAAKKVLEAFAPSAFEFKAALPAATLDAISRAGHDALPRPWGVIGCKVYSGERPVASFKSAANARFAVHALNMFEDILAENNRAWREVKRLGEKLNVSAGAREATPEKVGEAAEAVKTLFMNSRLPPFATIVETIAKAFGLDGETE